MTMLGFCAIVSICALPVAGLVILVVCVHHEVTRRATYKRFDAAADAYTEAFGPEAIIKLLDAAQKTDMDLDNISKVMENAVKAEREAIC